MKISVWRACVGASVSAALITTPASAQTFVTPAQTVVPPNVVPQGMVAPVVVTQPAPFVALPAPKYEVGRWRFAMNLGGGVHLVGGSRAGSLFGIALTGSLQLGVQLGRHIAVYYVNRPVVDIFRYTIGSDSNSMAVIADANAIVVNVTLWDLLELGAGPSFDVAFAQRCFVLAVGNVDCFGGSNVGLGVEGRIAFVPGQRNPYGGRREGFAAGLDVHPSVLFGGSSPITSMFVDFNVGWQLH